MIVLKTVADNADDRMVMRYTVKDNGHNPGDVRWAEVPFPRAIIDEM